MFDRLAGPDFDEGCDWSATPLLWTPQYASKLSDGSSEAVTVGAGLDPPVTAAWVSRPAVP